MSYISDAGLYGAYDVLKKSIEVLESNDTYKAVCLCEPQLGKRGMYPTVSKKGSYDAVKSMVDFIAYADGKRDLIAVSDLIHVPKREKGFVGNQ